MIQNFKKEIVIKFSNLWMQWEVDLKEEEKQMTWQIFQKQVSVWKK